MITHISVDGFKSLHNFQLDFTPGLNILVGPNGCGKTNIVSFFEFVTHLMQVDASEATSRVGGAGAVFRRIGNEYDKHIKAKLRGSVAIPSHYSSAAARRKKIAVKFLHYEYSFTLFFPETRDSVLFQKQHLKMRGANKFASNSEDAGEKEWHVDIEMAVSGDGSPTIKASSFEMQKLGISFFLVANARQKSELEQVLASLSSVSTSLINALARFSPGLWSMLNDISTGQIYNIIPSRIKLSEDSAKSPGIARDGSGLAATLYAIQKNKHPEQFEPWVYRTPSNLSFQHVEMKQLKSYLSLVNDSIEQISVENDTFDNQLKVRFTIRSGSYSAVVPMSLMSDGTLKWVALVTAALTSSSLFSIEEPENYLHPRMQGQIVGILREILFSDDANKFTLMTTHSETLLNHCKPDELIIVSMTEGKTIAKRCTNASDVSDEINRTGFGLGYYYISDALQNE